MTVLVTPSPEIVIFAEREDEEELALTVTVIVLSPEPDVGVMLHHDCDEVAVHDKLLVTAIEYELEDAVALIEEGDTVNSLISA